MTRLAAILVLVGLVASAAGAEPGGPRRYEPDEVRRALGEILARPEYNSPLAKLADRIEEAGLSVLRALRRLLRGVEALFVAAPLVYWLIVVGLVVLLVLLLTHIGWTVKRAITMGRTPAASDGPASAEAETPTSLRRRAETLAAQGRFLDAVRLLFRALALRLGARDAALVFPSLTNREFAAAFRTDPSLFERLRAFVEVLDDRWYGDRPCTAEDYALCHTMYDQVVRQARA